MPFVEIWLGCLAMLCFVNGPATELLTGPSIPAQIGLHRPYGNRLHRRYRWLDRRCCAAHGHGGLLADPALRSAATPLTLLR